MESVSAITFILFSIKQCVLWAYTLRDYTGFSGGSDGNESACNAGDLGLIPGLGRSPGEGNGNPPKFLPGESHGQRSLAGHSPWGPKESDTIEAAEHT